MTAKEMFEELGYIDITNEYSYDKDYKAVYVNIEYIPNVHIIFEEYGTTRVIDNEIEITMPLLKAINKQVEELGWTNDN